MSVRHDWYQTDTKVVITVLLKNAKDKNYKLNIDKETVTVEADNYNLKLNLYRPIDASKSSHKVTPSKIEIILVKETGERWNSLERKIENQNDTDIKLKLAQNNKWDKLAKQISEQETAEAQGEEALQNLFKSIYNNSSEEVRRAMNKSFMESEGTVLSTNWTEVGKEKVEVKPPDGSEFKKWD